MVRLLATLGRLLSGLVFDVLEGRTAPERAATEAREAATEARDTIPALAEEAGTAAHSRGVTEAGGEAVSEEQADSRDLRIAELSATLLSATRNMEEETKRQVREIARRRIEGAMAGDRDRGEFQKFAAELRERGIKPVDSAGRRWEPEAYGRMVVNSATAELRNSGHVSTAASIGSPGVVVSDGGDPPDDGRADADCIAVNGELWSLSFAMANLTDHPNCRRAFAAMPPGDDRPLDKE